MANTLIYKSFTIFADNNKYILSPTTNPGAAVTKIDIKDIFIGFSSTNKLGCTVKALGSNN